MSAVFPLLQKSVFPFPCKIILKMNQFRKTDEMEGILHRDDQSNVFYHVHKYFIHKTLWKIFLSLDSGSGGIIKALHARLSLSW